jgi:uncharacterized paraquat-inducible protein A
MNTDQDIPRKLRPVLLAVVEVASIVFLFYANLLMGEFTHLNGQGKTLLVAVWDIFSVANFGIAVIAGIVGYVAFEHFRKKV